ncbi:hypothetical protein A3A63_00370 [Candidatus Gottesmanbacteria bacterium RIFCSPLOWO2_01_FULL_46_9]|uniref:Uncharacterized protein n=1 Tax=Candidatus Gottesmanbacteria bacterium RIFCSPLOWO2_01_FULL_46_9 TaxID=1798394 RepID=A0A1F6B4A3_9BACT|nr:MAG: hypothetical protein A3A63_00370 [Candidatus Gottesmanbacteria bacterium RIFCSPLOWO2_01_FULL_46_9]
MGAIGQFVIALFIGATSLASGSLVWPRLTTQARPKLLQDVHDIVIKTPIGKQGASVLGVSDEAHVEPINIGQAVGSAAAGLRSAVQKRVQTIIVGNAVNQLSSQFDRLPQDQKERVQHILCKPSDK